MPHWALLYIPESDAYLDHRTPLDSPHTVYRHWPGPGGFAMQIIIRSRFKKLVQRVSWHGRSGAVHLFQKPGIHSTGINMYVIVVHSAHGAQMLILTESSQNALNSSKFRADYRSDFSF